MKIVVGSTSFLKIAAVNEACTILGLDAEVTGVETNSGQNAQPFGLSETLDGARTRALKAMRGDDSVVIGIENGVFRPGSEPLILDIAVIVVITKESRTIITTSSGIQFGFAHFKIAEGYGFEKTTVGSVIAERLGGDPRDPHSTVTEGKVSRQSLLVDALVVALKQL